MTLGLNKSYCGNRYYVRTRIDRTSPGGYAAVYLADDRVDGIPVAVKESLAQNTVAKQRFERERRVQQRLGGDHIVRVLGDDDFGSSRCLVLEYMAGGSLADDAARAALTSEQRTAVVSDVLRGLKLAHDANIVHRDLKPGNVLLDGAWNAKLADFGVAFVPDEPPLTAPTQVVGTDDWMAPQQAAGQPADPRDDLFAAGLLLYFLLTGAPPLMSRSGWKPRLDQVDDRYREIVRRATTESRGDRYPTAQAMLAALEAARGQAASAAIAASRLLYPEDLRVLIGPSAVRNLFRKLRYHATADADLVSLSAAELELGGAAAELVIEGYVVADVAGSDALLVLLLRVKDISGIAVRRVAQALMTRPSEFLLVFTDEHFNRFVFVNPRRAMAGRPTRLHKLVLERQQPTRHALDVLEGLACTVNDPAAVFRLQCDAFDVDEVTDRFYRRYAEVLNIATGRVREWNPGLALAQDPRRLDAFMQRLFGRLMFLHFLQKKGWLNAKPDFLTLQFRSGRAGWTELLPRGVRAAVLRGLEQRSCGQRIGVRPGAVLEWRSI